MEYACEFNSIAQALGRVWCFFILWDRAAVLYLDCICVALLECAVAVEGYGKNPAFLPRSNS
jgi:hypothetical protein